MQDRPFTERMRAFARRGLWPRSPAAFGFAALCVALATLARLAIDLVAPQAVPFATFFPAVLVATLIGGLAAGLFATLLSAIVAWWLFVPVRAWSALTTEHVVSIVLFLAAAATVIWVAAQYRHMVRRLDEEERYRQVVVDELGHRIKNKLATVYAILRHELRGHRDVWDSVAGRLRALSAADDFLVKAGHVGIPLREIVGGELAPYGAATVSMQGCEVKLHGKLAAVLALVFHELATNAAKYGALSSPEGGIDIAWREEEADIVVEWIEHGGPPVSPPPRRSFGSNLIERSLDGLGGTAKLDFPPGGVVCRVTFPKERVTLETPAAAPSLVP